MLVSIVLDTSPLRPSPVFSILLLTLVAFVPCLLVRPLPLLLRATPPDEASSGRRYLPFDRFLDVSPVRNSALSEAYSDDISYS